MLAPWPTEASSSSQPLEEPASAARGSDEGPARLCGRARHAGEIDLALPARATIRFAEAGDRARQHLDALAAVAREPVQHQATAETRAALERYRVQMGALEGITERTDRLIAEMNARATTLIGLADTARARQHQSNADIIASLAQGDRKLRAARDVVDGAHELRAATAAVETERLRAARGAAETAGRAGLDEQQQRLAFARARVRNAAKDLEQILQAGGAKEAGELASLIRRYEAETANLPTSVGSGEPRSPLAETELAEWIERLVKVNATEHRALHEETAQLLTYSVQAAETEQATQNIASATLKLARRAGDALAARDVAATGATLSADGRSDASPPLACSITEVERMTSCSDPPPSRSQRSSRAPRSLRPLLRRRLCSAPRATRRR